MMCRKYAPPLNKYYRFNPVEGTLVFEDQVEYTLQEAIFLSRSRIKDSDLEKIHLVKQIFHGILESPFGDPLERGHGDPHAEPVPEAEPQVSQAGAAPAVRGVAREPGKEISGDCQMRLEI